MHNLGSLGCRVAESHIKAAKEVCMFGESPGRLVAGSPSQIFQYNVGLHINAYLRLHDLGGQVAGSLGCRVTKSHIKAK